ncbi:hypothetical protein AB0M28_17380 [Streptomyces sp. NPDC051940]|uniref:hypothetical protein n=1 Tax=Streptomyces sp. NPDC051940 TaxID=3155675 RepID=UPI00341E360B
MSNQSTATRLVDQASSDLKENRRLQQELVTRIAVLKQEEALLTDILNLAKRYESFTDPTRLPEQLQDEPIAANVTRRASAGAEAATRGKTRRPLLGDLLLELLGKYDEPRLAKELRDELLTEHPDRNPTPQVVRNTLESLVAKGRVRRHKQQRSVMYTSH